MGGVRLHVEKAANDRDETTEGTWERSLCFFSEGLLGGVHAAAKCFVCFIDRVGVEAFGVI